MQILGLSGSLRANSSNTALVLAAQKLVPAGVELVFYDELNALPFFNSDLSDDATLPKPARSFRQIAVASDGVLISSPEYARGIAGVLKNALDWLVGAEDLAGTPSMVVNASPRAVSADAHLRLTLETMSLPVAAAASITLPLFGRGLDAVGILEDPELSSALSNALNAFVVAIRAKAAV